MEINSELQLGVKVSQEHQPPLYTAEYGIDPSRKTCLKARFQAQTQTSP